MWVYAVIAVAAMGFSLLWLWITKIPAIVALLAASSTAGIVVLASRLDLGYWDPFTIIVFATAWAVSFVVSLVFLLLGRRLNWLYFVAN